MAISLLKDTSSIDLVKGKNVVIVEDCSGSMRGNSDTPIPTEDNLKTGFIRQFFGKREEGGYLSRHDALRYLSSLFLKELLVNDPEPDFVTFADRHHYYRDSSIDSSGYKAYMNTPSSGEDYIIPALDEILKIHFERKNTRGQKNETMVFVLLDGACADRNKLPNWMREAAKKLDNKNELHFVFVKIGRVNLDDFYKNLDNLDSKFDLVSFFSLDEIAKHGLDSHLRKIVKAIS